MTDPTRYRSPSTVLSNAWSEFRLEALQSVAKRAIDELCRLEFVSLFGRERTPEECSFVPDPVTTALSACCDELRRESGLTEAHASQSSDAGERSEAWMTLFREALDRYRRTATTYLETYFSASARSAP